MKGGHTTTLPPYLTSSLKLRGSNIWGVQLLLAVFETAFSTLALIWELDRLASRMTQLMLGSLRMEMMSCSSSSSILTMSIVGCFWPSVEEPSAGALAHGDEHVGQHRCVVAGMVKHGGGYREVVERDIEA